MSEPARKAADRAPTANAPTPMMAQYFEIKGVNPGYLLFYRMGDFYELFFEDAEIASAALGITLTRRGKHLDQDIPMCGVPVHAAQDYLSKLIGLGHRVAVCEQVEDPAEAKKRGSKSVVKRDVVRLVTPGTVTEDDLLPSGVNNFLASLALLPHGDSECALAWADISTGELMIADVALESLADELTRIDPAELIVSGAAQARLAETGALSQALAGRMTPLDAAQFDSEAGARILRHTFADNSVDPTAFSRSARSALGALIGYIADTQKQAGVFLRPPRMETAAAQMRIDTATRASLELLTTNRGEKKGALRACIDMTVTAPGGRLLTRRLAAPLVDAAAINMRLDALSALKDNGFERARLRQTLKSVPDLARALTRLSLDRGGPRDVLAIAQAVGQAQTLGTDLDAIAMIPPGLSDLAATLASAPTDLADLLVSALQSEVPLLARDGGFVREGYHPELDTQRRLGSESRKIVAQLQASLVDQTGVRTLKIKHNNVLGFFVEVPAAHGQTLLEEPHKATFIHRQTLANAMRFTTGELADLEGKIARASDIAREIELEVFADLRTKVLDRAAPLQGLADALAELDLLCALAQLADERNYARPLIDTSLAFAIEGGRHPVVEAMLAENGTSFVANDCNLSAPPEGEGGQLWLVTGPNMGGKSTFLRQNALIAILAQMGSFVPASSAHIGVIDRVFSRVGASDDIAQGRSTFMVEMVETASILNRSTSGSLVILDEIGRGTATFDGLSIAWACVEALHETTGCRALFATHYHELTALSQSLARVSNHTMKVREYKGDVIFLHEVGPGAADRSYGIQVARLAGLPDPVLERARQVLDLLEKSEDGPKGQVLDQLPLFAHTAAPPQPRANPISSMVAAVRPDDMTPREALEWIYALKKAAHADSAR